MKTYCKISVAALMMSFGTAFGSGFALYQHSAHSHALGGTVIGKAVDASANFFNPATLSDLTNVQFTVGFITEHPRGNVRVNGKEESMDPGLFWLPHFQLAVPLPADFTFGLGFSPEFGLGSHYDDTWEMDWNSTETTVQGYEICPNIAYRITKDWSIGVGLRWLYFDFEQYKAPYADAYGYNSFEYRLKGNNNFNSFGYQIGTKYNILDNLSVGLVYKSAIDVTVDGKTTMGVRTALPGYAAALRQVALARTGGADADLTLPRSLTFGVNWDITDTWHTGLSASWTQWSEMNTLNFHVQPSTQAVGLHWEDTWRFTWGLQWDFAEDWSWMLGYVYDMDSTSEEQTSTMLPPAARHIASTGFSWNLWKGLEISVSYACIFMHGNSMDTTDDFGKSYHLETCRGFCHAGGVSLTYRF